MDVSMKDQSLSIVFPCYNESGNILNILSRCREIIGNRKDIEVLLVDNGSGDDSARIIDEALKEPQFFFARKVQVSVNKGYGYGILAGLHVASGVVAHT
jgi:glycosyltransferase involved in cell wall biosynthesis